MASTFNINYLCLLLQMGSSQCFFRNDRLNNVYISNLPDAAPCFPSRFELCHHKHQPSSYFIHSWVIMCQACEFFTRCESRSPVCMYVPGLSLLVFRTCLQAPGVCLHALGKLPYMNQCLLCVNMYDAFVCLFFFLHVLGVCIFMSWPCVGVVVCFDFRLVSPSSSCLNCNSACFEWAACQVTSAGSMLSFFFFAHHVHCFPLCELANGACRHMLVLRGPFRAWCIYVCLCVLFVFSFRLPEESLPGHKCPDVSLSAQH